jgi:ankyrin repeat protein
MLAAQNGHVDVVKALLENGADINPKNNNGNTALMLAKSPEIKEILESEEAKAKKISDADQKLSPETRESDNQQQEDAAPPADDYKAGYIGDVKES